MKKSAILLLLITACQQSPESIKLSADIDDCKKEVQYVDQFGVALVGAAAGAAIGAAVGGSVDDSIARETALSGAASGGATAGVGALLTSGNQDMAMMACLKKKGHPINE